LGQKARQQRAAAVVLCKGGDAIFERLLVEPRQPHVHLAMVVRERRVLLALLW
jgi:hypothetical protein